jgi:hypothetical protein
VHYGDAHIKFFHRAVELRSELFRLFLILRDAQNVLALGANELLQSVALLRRGRSMQPCLSGQFDLLECAARLRQTTLSDGMVEDAQEQPRYVPLHSLQLVWTDLEDRVRDSCE